MNHRFFATALTAGALSLASVASAQAAGPQAPATTAAAPAPTVKPEAMPAKIALIAFEQAVFATNEGQKAVADVQKKYEPQRAKIEAAAAEIDSLKKQLQAATTDDQRGNLTRSIDTKEKQYQRDGEDASAAYQQELQDAYGKVATKVADVMRKYVADNGYTLLLDVSGQQSAVMWADQRTDITRAVIDSYNTASGVAAPAAAPRTAPPARTTPRATTPKK